jgi:hypothetical protein
MIWIFHCLFDISLSVPLFSQKKRLENKDIAFYASLNSDLAERAKEEISIPLGILSRTAIERGRTFDG